MSIRDTLRRRKVRRRLHQPGRAPSCFAEHELTPARSAWLDGVKGKAVTVSGPPGVDAGEDWSHVTDLDGVAMAREVIHIWGECAQQAWPDTWRQTVGKLTAALDERERQLRLATA